MFDLNDIRQSLLHNKVGEWRCSRTDHCLPGKAGEENPATRNVPAMCKKKGKECYRKECAHATQRTQRKSIP